MTMDFKTMNTKRLALAFELSKKTEVTLVAFDLYHVGRLLGFLSDEKLSLNSIDLEAMGIEPLGISMEAGYSVDSENRHLYLISYDIFAANFLRQTNNKAGAIKNLDIILARLATGLLFVSLHDDAETERLENDILEEWALAGFK